MVVNLNDNIREGTVIIVTKRKKFCQPNSITIYPKNCRKNRSKNNIELLEIYHYIKRGNKSNLSSHGHSKSYTIKANNYKQ